MDGGGHAAAAAELGRDHELALVLGLDGQEARAVDVDVEEVVVGVPRLHALEHRAALLGVVDDVHVRARDEPGGAPAGVHVDHDVRRREEDAREVVGELLVRRPVRRAGERAVEVHARRPHPRVRLRRGGREHRDDRDAPRDLLGLQLLDQPQRRDLALVLVAVVPGEDEHVRPVAVRDRRDRDEGARPAAGVRDLRELEPAELLARSREVDRAGDLGGRVTRVRPAPRRPRPPSPRAADRRPRRCARTRSGSASGSAAARRCRASSARAGSR